MNKFLKFFFSVFMVLLPFLLINGLYIKAEYSQGDSDLTKFREVPSNINLVNLGSSLGKFSFDYKNYPELNAYNFALLQQYLEFDKSVLVQFKDKLSKNAIVLIIVGMIEYDSIPSSETVANVEKKYYQFIDLKNLPDKSFSKYIKLKFFPVLAAGHPFKTIWKYYSKFFDKSKDSDISEHQIKRFSDNSHEEQVSISKSEFKRCFEPFPRFGEKGLDYNENLVSDIIEICRENDFVPVVVSTPMTKTFLECYPSEPGFIEAISKFKNDLHKKYPDVKWMDYSYDKNLSDKPEFFMDPFHLNYDGALIFTDEIISDLKKFKLLK